MEGLEAKVSSLEAAAESKGDELERVQFNYQSLLEDHETLMEQGLYERAQIQELEAKIAEMTQVLTADFVILLFLLVLNGGEKERRQSRGDVVDEWSCGYTESDCLLDRSTADRALLPCSL